MKHDTMKIITAILFLFSIYNVGYTQQSGGTSGKFSNGTIISSESATMREELHMANKTYDENIVGVFNETNTKDMNKTYMKQMPVAASGITFVKYNSENGSIKKGDFITSSSEAGVGMKATKTGMVLGVALEDAVSSSGMVKIRVLIQYVKQ